LGFVAMALTRLGIAYPRHTLFDTLDMARELYPTWSSHSLEDVATRLKVANRAEHRALPNARLVEAIFLAMLEEIPTVNTIVDVMHVTQPRTFADAPVCAIEPPPGFEMLTTAITERCAVTIVYEHGWQRPQPRMITPRLVREAHRVAYVIAHRHVSDAERTFRLDRIGGGRTFACNRHPGHPGSHEPTGRIVPLLGVSARPPWLVKSADGHRDPIMALHVKVEPMGSSFMLSDEATAYGHFARDDITHRRHGNASGRAPGCVLRAFTVHCAIEQDRDQDRQLFRSEGD
jgi:hypothetical protein